MTSRSASFVISAVTVGFLSCLSPRGAAGEKLTKNEYTVLKVCDAIIRMSRKAPDALWPGYDLSSRPLIVYIPGRWALLLNRDGPVEGFSPYPKDWPSLSGPALIHRGQYGDLLGQLAFDLQVDTIRTVAIGAQEEYLDSLPQPELWLFGLCVHEAFHQFQSDRFGEIPWEREERYPILDAENTSLACIEMRLLGDALAKTGPDAAARRRELIRQFLAVRHYRWQHADPFVARYEQGQEIREGTARYVEMRAVELVRGLEGSPVLDQFTRPLRQDFDSIAFPGILLGDFRDRMTGLTVRPDDMLRNRIYPVGSAMGFLLDDLGIVWKPQAQAAGTAFTFEGAFAAGLGLPEDTSAGTLARAKDAYGFEAILASSRSGITEYLEGFQKALASFDSQDGCRIRVEFTAKSLSRSRSSRAKKWLIDKGTESLCAAYEVYTVKNSDFMLQVRNSGVQEHSDWDTRKYSVTFFSPAPPRIVLDSAAASPSGGRPFTFRTAELSGAIFRFTSSKPGTVTADERHVTIRLNQ